MKKIPAVALALAACGSLSDAPGTYEVISPDAAGGERHVRVVLKKDGEASLSRAFSERPSRSFALGTWKREDNRIAVDLNDNTRMVFQLRADLLVPVEWDRTIWGEAGPGVLERRFIRER